MVDHGPLIHANCGQWRRDRPKPIPGLGEPLNTQAQMDAPTGSDGTDSTFSWAASQRFSQRSWADFNPSQARCGKCAGLIEPAALACRRCVSPTPVGCPRSWMDTTLNSHSAPAVRHHVPMSSSFSSPFGSSQMRRRSKTSDNVPLQRKGSFPLGMFVHVRPQGSRGRRLLLSQAARSCSHGGGAHAVGV